VFTQFRELTGPLAKFPTPKAVSSTAVRGKKCGEIVDAFQGEDDVPFIVLSLKTGGTGLNLTKAIHVLHFDRWWRIRPPTGPTASGRPGI